LKTLRGGLLKPCSQIRGVSHGRVIHAQIVANLSDHDGTGVETHAHLELDTAFGHELIPVDTQGPLHAERCMYPPAPDDPHGQSGHRTAP
jgi:hypothetical protein